MGLWEDIQPQLDPNTHLLMAPDGGKDNLILYSAYLLRELAIQKDHPSCMILQSEMHSYLYSNQVAKGLYRRRPGATNSIDNLIGAAFSQCPNVALDIIWRWQTFSGCFDCDNPDSGFFGLLFKKRLNYWFARFIGVKAFVKVCAGIKPTIIDRLAWNLSTLFSIYFSKGSSDPLLQSLQNDAMEEQGYSLWLIKLWKKKYAVEYLYYQYFGPNHPLTKSRELFQEKISLGLIK